MQALPDHDEGSDYRTYLLTCWRERDSLAGTTTWRFRLETPLTGRRRLFALLTNVMAVIEMELLGNSKRDGKGGPDLDG